MKSRLITIFVSLLVLVTALSVSVQAQAESETNGTELFAAIYEPSAYLTQTNTTPLHEAGIKGMRSDGTRVRVVVIDTGVDTDHEAFMDKNGEPIFSPLSYNATTKQTVAEAGLSVIEDQYVQGLGYHGTSVCGVIASQLKDYPGTAPECELVMVKCVWGSDGFETADLLHAMDYAISLEPSVISVSWGIAEEVEARACLEADLAEAVSKKITVVCAAGNNNSTALSLPASLSDTICVGAVDKKNEKAMYSNYGNIDIVAPGNLITVAYGGGTQTVNGTSFAAPMVAGIAALYYAEHPDADVDGLTSALTLTATDLGNSGVDVLYGYGLVNANAAVTEVPGVLTLISGNQYMKTPVYFNHPVQEVPALKADDAYFVGWYLDDSFTMQVGFPTQFTKNTTLTARWQYYCRIHIGDEIVSTNKYDPGNIISYPAKRGFTLVIEDKPTYMGNESLDLYGEWVLKEITVNKAPAGLVKNYDGEGVILTYQVTHSLSEALTFEWYCDGELIADANDNSLYLEGNPEDSGNYTCVATVSADGQTVTATGEFPVYILQNSVEIPTVKNTVYNGAEQAPTFEGWDDNLMEIDPITKLHAGVYEIEIRLKNQSDRFTDGSQTVTVEWRIEKAKNEISDTSNLPDISGKTDFSSEVGKELIFPEFDAAFGKARVVTDTSEFTSPGEYTVVYRTDENEDYYAAEYEYHLLLTEGDEAPEESGQSSEKTGGGSNLIIIIIAVILGGAGGGLGVYLLMRKKSAH